MLHFLWIDRYTDALQQFLAGHIVLAPLLLLLAEEAGVPIIIPGDAIVGYVGYELATTHRSSLWEAFVVALLSVIIGSTILFYLSRRWGQMVIDNISKFIFVKESHVHHAERLFAKYGVWAIIFGRHIPGLRIPVTILAATSGVRYVTFLLCTILSTALWILFYLSIGKRFGADFHALFIRYLSISAAIALAAIVAVLVLRFLGLRRHKKI